MADANSKSQPPATKVILTEREQRFERRFANERVVLVGPDGRKEMAREQATRDQRVRRG